MDVSIIIVNWKSKAYLRNCLRSIRAQATPLTIEILVIDNASADGCGAMLADEFPGVHYLESQENLGFELAADDHAAHRGGSEQHPGNLQRWGAQDHAREIRTGQTQTNRSQGVLKS